MKELKEEMKIIKNKNFYDEKQQRNSKKVYKNT